MREEHALDAPRSSYWPSGTTDTIGRSGEMWLLFSTDASIMARLFAHEYQCLIRVVDSARA